MAKSKEYTDLNFVAPKAQAFGRPNGDVIWNVIHTTEGAFNSQAAANGAAYDARRTDDVSTHFFIDDVNTVQCVYTWDRAYTARTIPNNRGVHYELCARASWTRDQWLNAYGKAMLENAAKQSARVAKKYGIPARWITDVQMLNREKGFTTHGQCSRVLEGTHTDPGPNFPADYFMSRVKYYLGETTAAGGGGSSIAAGEVEVDMDGSTVFNVDKNGDGKLEAVPYKDVIGWLVGMQLEHKKNFAAINVALKSLGASTVDEAALAANLAKALKGTSSAAISQADLETALRNVLGSLG